MFKGKKMGLLKNKIEGKRNLVLGILLVVFLVGFWVLPAVGPWSSFTVNDDWSGTIEIDGLYFPQYNHLYAQNPGTSSRDNFLYDIDGNPAAPYRHDVFGVETMFKTMFKWQDDGTDCEQSFVTSVPSDGTGKTAKIYNPDWWPDFNKYPTMMPLVNWKIGDLIQVGGNVFTDVQVYDDYFSGNVQTSVTLDRIVDENTPSIYGSMHDGQYYYEGYYFYMQVVVELEARELGTAGQGYFLTLNHDGNYAQVWNLPYVYELSPIESMECVFKIDYSATNDSIIHQFSDMKTFGPLTVEFYKSGNDFDISSRVSYSAVEDEMENNERSYSDLFGSYQGGNINKDIVLSGMDRHAGLQVVDESVIPELSSDGDYFYFGFDKIANPAYWEAHTNLINLRDYYNMVAYDMKVYVPLLACVFNIYDLDAQGIPEINVGTGTDTYSITTNNDGGSDDNDNEEREGMFNVPSSLEDAFTPESIGFTMIVIVVAIILMKRR